MYNFDGQVVPFSNRLVVEIVRTQNYFCGELSGELLQHLFLVRVF